LTEENCIVGGMFGLETSVLPRSSSPSFLTDRDLLLANGQSAIWLLVNQLRPTQVWVPSYLCESILGAIDRKLSFTRFYEVDYDLHIVSDQWISEVISRDLVIFIDYFGFSYDRRFAVLAKGRGAWVLEDAVQSLLSSHVGPHSDFVLFSLRKWMGVPDGGILRFTDKIPVFDVPLTSPESAWWLKALQANILRREFDDGLPNRQWFEIFKETERLAPVGPYAMSELARSILEHSVDCANISTIRLRNYENLLEKLGPYAMFPRLDRGVVPLGFPVRMENRDSVRQALFDQAIYPPVHWPIDQSVPEQYRESHRLAGDIMTIPCDQRYRAEDMERIADVILRNTK
jgi:hypothetical protein